MQIRIQLPSGTIPLKEQYEMQSRVVCKELKAAMQERVLLPRIDVYLGSDKMVWY